jgi:hypothetical protein
MVVVGIVTSLLKLGKFSTDCKLLTLLAATPQAPFCTAQTVWLPCSDGQIGRSEDEAIGAAPHRWPAAAAARAERAPAPKNALD